MDDSTVFKGRLKTTPSAFLALGQRICHAFHDHAQKALWKGFRLIAVDGSALRLPHWAGIASYFQPERQGQAGTDCRLDRVVQQPLARALGPLFEGRFRKQGHLPREPQRGRPEPPSFEIAAASIPSLDFAAETR